MMLFVFKRIVRIKWSKKIKNDKTWHEFRMHKEKRKKN